MSLLAVDIELSDRRLAVGRLAWRDRRALFEYDARFLKSGLDLSPLRLPLRPGVQTAPRQPFAGLFGLFADCLPDSYGRLLLDRRLRQMGRDPATLTPLERLALVGERGPGGLRFTPADELGVPDSVIEDLDRVQAEALAVIAGAPSDMLAKLEQLGGSAGGARPKALLWLNEATGALSAVESPGFTSWLVKFRAPADREDIGAVEAAYAAMAEQAGIAIAPWRLLPSAAGPGHFAARRFDRGQDGPRHLHSLAGLLEADPDGASVSYSEYLKATAFLTRDVRATEQACRRMIFNMLAHNRDDHAKNHAFLMDASGAWTLSPAYDLTFAPGPGGEHYLAIDGEGRAPTLDHARREAARAGISARRVAVIIDEVSAAVAEWPRFARDHGVSRTSAAEIGEKLPK